MSAPAIQCHVWVCPCCLFMLVNGDGCECGDDVREHPHALASLLAGDDVTPDYCADHYENGDETCENCGDVRDDDGHATFSSDRCDGCGTDLAGERFQFAVWESPAT